MNKTVLIWRPLPQEETRVIKKLSYGKARIRDLTKSQKKSTGKVKVKKSQIEKSKQVKKINHRPQLEKFQKKS